MTPHWCPVGYNHDGPCVVCGWTGPEIGPAVEKPPPAETLGELTAARGWCTPSSTEYTL